MEQNHTHHINYKIPIFAIICLLLGVGYFAFIHLKTGLFPDITFPKIKVIADAGQKPIDKMMATVTVPLENMIKKTEGLDYIRSTTSRGSCEISVFLKWDADMDNAKQQIESFVNQSLATLPANTAISVEKMNPSILPVMGYALDGNRSQVDLKKIAQYQIKPFLSAVDGVSNVAVIGGKTKEYQIIVNPAQLSLLHISLAQIQTVITQANILQSNGYIRDHNRLYLTLTDNALDNMEELKNLVIQNSPSRLVLLRDVATIELNEAKEYVKINANGKDIPLIAISKQAKANLIEVNNGIEAKVKELEKMLPKDVKLIPYYKQAEFVNDSIKSIQDVLWIGLVLSLIVVIIFLRSVSASTVVLVSIPFSLSLTLLVLYAFGYTFNIMTLGAIAASIGLMIDDVVIVVEQIFKNREEFPDEKIGTIVSKSIRYLLPAMVGSSLSTIVIFIPFILMSGIAGAYFKVLAYTMIIALSSSFIVSWWITPVLFLIFSVKNKKPKVHVPKTNWINFFLRKPIIGFVFAGFCAATLLIIPNKLPTGFLPEMDEGSLVLDFESPAGSTLEATDKMLQKVDAILKAQPEVQSYSRRLGTQMGFFITEPNRGDFLIQLKKKRPHTTDEVADLLRKNIEAKVPALRVDFGQVIGDMLGDLMSSVQPIEIKVFGDDEKKLETLSKQITEQVEKTKGTADAFNGLIIAGPEVNIQPNVALLAQLGMNPSDFQFQMQTQIEGNVISTIFDKEQQVNVRLVYPNAVATNVHSLQTTNIILPNGALKPLSSVATIELGKGEAEINRENQKMMGVVTARLNDRDLGSTLKDIKENIAKNIHLPYDYHIEYAGSYAQQQQSFKELMMILITAMLLVFIVILFLFKKVRIALLIIVLAILGVSGSLLALYLTHTPLNVGSYTGIIMIVGIIGENSIFTYFQYIEAMKTMSNEDSISYSIATRLRPKLMTACSAIIALFPLALGIGTGAQLHQPLAIAVIGGLLFALPLLLIVLPTFQKYFNTHSPSTN